MRSSNLINESSVTRALQDILQGLNEAGLLPKMLELVGSSTRQMPSRLFPEFGLLTPHRKYPPYQWFLPKPRVSVQEFLRIYDEFADAVHRDIENPADVAARIYARHSRSSHLLKHFSDSSQWLAAGHTLLAAALWLGAEQEEDKQGLVRMRLGPGLLEVAPYGVWSNAQKKTLTAWHTPESYSWPLVSFPATSSSNPILLAVATLSENLDPVLLRAANLIAIALKEEVVNRGFLRVALDKQAAKILTTSRRTPDKVEAATAALQQCTELLEQAQEDLLSELYAAAVPRLIPAAKFRSLFGSASQADPLREVKASTRDRWREKLEHEFNRIVDAVV